MHAVVHRIIQPSLVLTPLSASNILDVKLIQVNEIRNSNAMELEGLKRCLIFFKYNFFI